MTARRAPAAHLCRRVGSGRQLAFVPARARPGGPGAAAGRAGGDRMTATTASIRFDPDGAAKVQSYVRLTGSTYVHCCTYADAAPILTIQDGPADITITNPGRGEVTEEDV